MPAISTGYPAGGPRHDMHDRFYMVAERRVVSVTAVGSAWLCMTEGRMPDLMLAANSCEC